MVARSVDVDWICRNKYYVIYLDRQSIDCSCTSHAVFATRSIFRLRVID